MRECISISSSLPSCRTRPQGGSSGPPLPGHPMVSWFSAMLILRSACGHRNPGKTKSHAILSVRSRDFQGTRVSTLLIPPSRPPKTSPLFTGHPAPLSQCTWAFKNQRKGSVLPATSALCPAQGKVGIWLPSYSWGSIKDEIEEATHTFVSQKIPQPFVSQPWPLFLAPSSE